MGIDTSIYAHLLRPPKSVAEYDAEAQQGETNKLALMMNRAKMDEYKRGIEQDNALAGAYKEAVGEDGKTDRNKLYSSLAKSGHGAKISAAQKGYADQDKAEREAEIATTKAALEKFAAVRQFISPATNQAEYDLGIQNMAATLGPDSVKGVPPIFNAAQIKNGEMQALSIEKQLEVRFKELEADGKVKDRDLKEREFGYKQKHDTDKLNEDRRNNNMTDSRGRVANNLKAQENGITRDGIVGKRTQDVELKLQDDYRTESKGWSETSTAMKKITGAINTADKNPGSALAAGTAFMKLLDPNSVVRESELGMALNASGWFDRATSIASTLQNGKIMTATQKKNLGDAADNLFEEAKAAQREVDIAYRKRAKDYGADPDRVIVDRGQNTPRNKPGAAQGKPPPAKNARGWVLHTDAKGNKAYVSPDGKQYEEVR